MYGFQPSTPAERLLPLAGATAEAADRLTTIRDIRDVVYQLIKLSKERIAARSTRTAPLFHPDDYVYLSTKGLNIRSQKCKHLRDQRLGPFKIICKVGINSYKLRRLPTACPGSRDRSELTTAGETVGSSPTSSRWALETPVTRTRLGDGRRLSGERCGGCGTIGEEIVQQPPQPVFLTPGPIRRVPKLGKVF